MEEYDATELGEKEKLDILKNKTTRRAFLENSDHRIRFLFTPKHCSWLNPIEHWFAQLQRHIIRNGNLFSVQEPEHKILTYVYF